MAFDNEKSNLLLSIDKNGHGDYIQVHEIRDKSNDELKSLDIRQYYTADDISGELAPTKKGVRIPADKIKDLAEVLSKFNET